MTSPALALRSDLVCREIRFDRRRMWVIKDPFREKFFHLSADELLILQNLDGRRTVEEAYETFQHQRPDRFLGADDFVSFVAHFVREGLIAGGTTPPPKKKSWIERLPNPLAIQLPGWDPTGFLRTTYPLVAWIGTRPAFVAGALLALGAALCVLSSLDRLLLDLSQARNWATADFLLTFLVLLSLSKGIHELAHAYSCVRFGGACRKSGVMLLLLMPTLYCDVSDAWLMPSRRHRILVSAAGMLAELVLASLAAFVWWGTAPGLPHFLALSLMTVCSLNTVLVNGNPLLKYDGYYILSDAIGRPNLASDATEALRKGFLRIVFGAQTGGRPELDARPEWPAVVYGLASGGYRIAMAVLIAYGLVRAGHRQPWEPVATLLAAVILGGLVIRTAAPLAREIVRQGRERFVGWGRLSTGLVVLGMVAVGVALVPISNPVKAPALVELAASQDVFLTVGGILSECEPAGTVVNEGSLIARLRNPELEIRLLDLESQRAGYEQRLKAIEARRVDNPALADEIPTLRKTIEGLDSRIKLAHDELSRLAIRSPLAGRIWPPRNVAAKAVDPRELRDWHGTPLDPANRAAYLPEGTQLCTIGSGGGGGEDFVVRAYVSQRDVEHVRIGQAAWVGLSGQVLDLPRGTVERISATPSATLPREVALLNELPVEASASSKDGPRPSEPVYEVTIRMESPAAVSLRSAALVRIEPPWTPLWRWVLRQVRQALRFPTT